MRLSTCLHVLPLPLHPLALEAYFPSVTSSSALHLDEREWQSCVTASTTAPLAALRMLCIDGATFTMQQHPGLGVLPQIFVAAAALPALRALRLSTARTLGLWPADGNVVQSFGSMLSQLQGLTRLSLDVGVFTCELASALVQAAPWMSQLQVPYSYA